MRRLVSLSLLLLLAAGVRGQQATNYSNIVTNYLMINPAVTGSTPCLDLKLGIRQQWAGFEGAPTGAFGAIHGTVGEKKRNFHGLGAMVETDDTGPISFTSIHALYAYHMKLTRNAQLSVGIAAGFEQYRFNYAELTLSNFNDPIITGGFQQYLLPKINFGAWLYKSDRFIGVSFRNMVPNRITNFGEGSEATRRMHFTLTAGKLVDMSEDFTFRPAVQLMYVGRSRPSIDMQAVVDYNEKLQVGLGFRTGYGLIGLIKVDVFDYVSVGYAYDLTLNRVRYASPHTHEVVIGIQACPKGGYGNRLPCAAYD